MTEKKTLIRYRKWVLALILVGDGFFVSLGLYLSAIPYMRGVESDAALAFPIFGILFASGFTSHAYTVVREYFRNGPAIIIGEQGILLFRIGPEIVPWHVIDDILMADFGRNSRFILLEVNDRRKYHNPPYLPLRFAKSISFSGGIKMYLDGIAATNDEIRELIRLYKPSSNQYSL